MKKYLSILFAAALFCACDSSAVKEPGITGESTADVEVGSPSTSGENSGEGQTHAGQVTAGEWRDLDNWLFWSNLMTNPQADQEGSDYTIYSNLWGFYTNNRIAVRVTDENGVPQRDVPVVLNLHNSVLDIAPTMAYKGRTDNKGEVNLWLGLTQLQENTDGLNLGLLVGNEGEKPVVITHWGEEVQWNECVTSSFTPSKNIDIAFIVDATGSMSDEINFLKDDLLDIITKVANQHTDAAIRTAALFYRDEGDDYLTRVQDFTSDATATMAFIQQQEANGGGDFPEAVHTALEEGLQKLSWREDRSIRLVFMLLDAPPHQYDNVLASLHTTIPQYSQAGIRIIPVAASGIDKATEFFLRFTAIATDATYVFLTNDSGIGNEHIAATVGEYQVELLNDLIVRLINQYLE